MLGDLEKVPEKSEKKKTVIIKNKTTSPEIIHKALINLTNNRGFMVWAYIVAKQEDGYLSSGDAENYGITLKMFRDGVKELINKGYLNWVEKNIWEFTAQGKNTIQ